MKNIEKIQRKEMKIREMIKNKNTLFIINNNNNNYYFCKEKKNFAQEL